MLPADPRGSQRAGVHRRSPAEVRELGKPGGRWLPSGSFDIKPARAKLLELAKAMMDKDAPTQNLK